MTKTTPKKTNQTIYTKIFEKKLEPILFHDKDWFVILSNRPINEGHLLVVPVKPSTHFYETPNIARGFEIATHFAKILYRVYNPKRVSLFAKGFSVEEHAHIHVHPIYKREEMNVDVADMRIIDNAEMEEVAAKIKTALSLQPLN